MHKSRSVLLGLLALILLPGTFGCIAASASADSAVPSFQISPQATNPPSAVESNAVSSLPQAASGPIAVLRAASGASVMFMTQNGQAVGDVPPRMSELPHLVLYRNGALTGPDERTLIVEVTGIEAVAPGVTVTLEIETQHGDPDLRDGPDNRIPVWRESQWIANTSGSTQTGVTAVFRHEFGEAVMAGTETIATPTDYFRYGITVTEADYPVSDPVTTFSQDYAFLMENQWIAQLPDVQETSDGAAPDELVVHYCDMVPFQRNGNDATTRLPRGSVPAYVGTELAPRMVEAIRAETNDWGFPWHDAWTSFRPETDPERLSVVLTEGQTWFYGVAPSRGHAGISINVKGGDNARYETLSDGIMSIFYHELFHSLQRNINLRNGGDGDVDGKDDAWRFFSEGMAVLATSVGQSGVQFASAAHTYMDDANGFVGGGGRVGDLNKSYERMIPYHAVLYWRFLYEQCGGMVHGVENAASGMQIIRRALIVLYSGDFVDIDASTELVGTVPAIMDRALAGSACPFQSYEESLVALSRAIYTLRLGGGRCLAPGAPAGCGFYDPHNLYYDPPFNTVNYAGAEQRYSGEVKSSFGMDFVDMVLDPAANGQPLTLEFYGAPGAGAVFNVQLWQLVDAGGDARPQPVPAQAMAPEVLTRTNSDGHLSYVIPAIDTSAYNRLGLIITRVDAKEGSDPIGEYTIVLHPEAGQ